MADSPAPDGRTWTLKRSPEVVRLRAELDQAEQIGVHWNRRWIEACQQLDQARDALKGFTEAVHDWAREAAHGEPGWEAFDRLLDRADAALAASGGCGPAGEETTEEEKP